MNEFSCRCCVQWLDRFCLIGVQPSLASMAQNLTRHILEVPSGAGLALRNYSETRFRGKMADMAAVTVFRRGHLLSPRVGASKAQLAICRQCICRLLGKKTSHTLFVVELAVGTVEALVLSRGCCGCANCREIQN